jgi:hypothetical protein
LNLEGIIVNDFGKYEPEAQVYYNVVVFNRHTYATHLLEDGIDTRFIQELIGHASIKTTQIYSHVTDKNIKNIVNPLDRIDILAKHNEKIYPIHISLMLQASVKQTVNRL